MKFYTGRGDDGTSTILGVSKRISKSDKCFEALGAVDELNSYLGICRSLAKNKDIQSALLKAQEDLFIIQAELGSKSNLKRPAFYGRRTSIEVLKKKQMQDLEKTIDKFGGAVGALTKFTIPGGSPLSAHLDFARAVCRRAELTYLATRLPSGNRVAQTYLNRLSSLLFVLARYANKKARVREKNPSYK